MNVTIQIDDATVEAIAQRAAEIVAGVVPPQGAVGFLDVSGAAEYLACPTSRIYKLVSARRIPYLKDGSRTLFDREELRKWVKAGGARCP